MSTRKHAASPAKRVPIAMNADEIGALKQLAVREQRSVSAMAGIIYRAGLKNYNLLSRARPSGSK
jgi:hypothetical protein